LTDLNVLAHTFHAYNLCPVVICRAFMQATTVCDYSCRPAWNATQSSSHVDRPPHSNHRTPWCKLQISRRVQLLHLHDQRRKTQRHWCLDLCCL